MTNSVDLSEIVFYDPVPMHVVTAWCSLLIPIVLAIRCAFIRDRNAPSASRTAQRVLLAITMQFAFLAFCVTTHFVDLWMEQTIMAGTYGTRSILPSIYLDTISFGLVWPLTIQMVVTLGSGWFIVRRLRTLPRFWTPWFTVLAFCIFGGVHVVLYIIRRHVEN